MVSRCSWNVFVRVRLRVRAGVAGVAGVAISGNTSAKYYHSREHSTSLGVGNQSWPMRYNQTVHGAINAVVHVQVLWYWLNWFCRYQAQVEPVACSHVYLGMDFVKWQTPGSSTSRLFNLGESAVGCWCELLS